MTAPLYLQSILNVCVIINYGVFKQTFLAIFAMVLLYMNNFVTSAFNTTTGMPYGTVNLMHGVPPGETTVTCTAGVGTFIVEFGALTRLTGDPAFEEAALRALDALWGRRSFIGLVRCNFLLI